MRRAGALLLAAGLLASGCGTDDRDASSGASSAAPTSPATPAAIAPSAATPTEAPTPDLARARVRLAEVASFDQPVAMATRPGDSAIYVAEQPGTVRALRRGAGDPETVLDISEDVSFGGEQGLLGLTFSPDGRFLYVDFTDTNGDTRISELRMAGDVPVPSSRRDVLFVDQPFSNHNGGQILFGPDGFLYVALGDGGGGGDPLEAGQSLETHLGKILRIDPRPSGGQPYGIPRDNPFRGKAGARPEVWAYGLRNPWRFTFDRATGDLWIGDVGESAVEEIDFEPSSSRGGRNYGWDAFEGSRRFEGGARGTPVPPIHEYARSGGTCAVTGGYVYRGEAIPALRGGYVFGDFCEGRLVAIRQRNGKVVQKRALGPVVPALSSFGEDQDGELYAMSLEGGLFKLERR